MHALSNGVTALIVCARRELTELVAIGSVFAGTTRDECKRAADWVLQRLLELDFEARVKHTADGSPAVMGSVATLPGQPTVMLYAHHEVQLVDETAWTSAPSALTERGRRCYGRGTADCKGSIVAHLAALRSVRAREGSYPVGIVGMVEGSEEQTTGSVESYVTANVNEFCDVSSVVVMDAGNAAVGEPGGGGSIPFCHVLVQAVPGVEIITCGVCEPQAAAHGDYERVDPTEIRALALAEAAFLTGHVAAESRSVVTTAPPQERSDP